MIEYKRFFSESLSTLYVNITQINEDTVFIDYCGSHMEYRISPESQILSVNGKRIFTCVDEKSKWLHLIPVKVRGEINAILIEILHYAVSRGLKKIVFSSWCELRGMQIIDLLRVAYENVEASIQRRQPKLSAVFEEMKLEFLNYDSAILSYTLLSRKDKKELLDDESIDYFIELLEGIRSELNVANFVSSNNSVDVVIDKVQEQGKKIGNDKINVTFQKAFKKIREKQYMYFLDNGLLEALTGSDETTFEQWETKCITNPIVTEYMTLTYNSTAVTRLKKGNQVNASKRPLIVLMCYLMRCDTFELNSLLSSANLPCSNEAMFPGERLIRELMNEGRYELADLDERVDKVCEGLAQNDRYWNLESLFGNEE